MLTNKFGYVCYALVASYGIIGLISIVQLSRLNKRDEGSVCRYFKKSSKYFSTISTQPVSFLQSNNCDYKNSSSCLLPSTVQQFIHLIVLILCSGIISYYIIINYDRNIFFYTIFNHLICLVRIAFFFCAVKSWDPYKGEVYSRKVEFYSLDEFSSALFFSLTSMLALFWAELYYISINRPDIFVWFVRPSINFIIMGAFAAVSVCSWIVSKSYMNDVDYVFLQYTILISGIYLLAACNLSYYAYVAAAELKKVSIIIPARKDRLFSLRILAFICISALIFKAGILIYLNGRKIETVSTIMLVSVYFYYFFAELFPVCVILTFYRVELLIRVNDHDKDHTISNIQQQNKYISHININNQTSSDANNNNVHGSNKKISGSVGTKRTLRSVSPIHLITNHNSSNPDIVDAIIARLSIETGLFYNNRSNSEDASDKSVDDIDRHSWTSDSGEEEGLLYSPDKYGFIDS